jgi:glucan phosphoethanolaminetransferase (alkaline phosphatase superfamily)
MYLVEAGIVNLAQVDTALTEQEDSERRLGEILAARGWVEQQTIEYLIEKVVLPERQVVRELSQPEEKGSHQKHDLTSLEQASLAEPGNYNFLRLSGLPSRELEISITPRRTSRFLLLIVLGLILTSMVIQFSVYYLPDFPLRHTLAELFNTNTELNIPTLYSWSALLVCSMLLAIIAYAKKVAGEQYFNHWLALSIIFLYLSLDEAISLHERTGYIVADKLHTDGFLYFAWVIPGFIFVLVCFLAFLQFIATLSAKTRRLFLIAGTVYVVGALGLELLGGYWADFYGEQNITYVLITTMEEFLEMLGIVIFIYTLLSYISCYMKGVSLRVKIMDDRKQRRSAQLAK